MPIDEEIATCELAALLVALALLDYQYRAQEEKRTMLGCDRAPLASKEAEPLCMA